MTTSSVSTIKNPFIMLLWVLLDFSEGKFRDESISVTLENMEKSLKQNLSPLLCFTVIILPIEKHFTFKNLEIHTILAQL